MPSVRASVTGASAGAERRQRPLGKPSHKRSDKGLPHKRVRTCADRLDRMTGPAALVDERHDQRLRGSRSPAKKSRPGDGCRCPPRACGPWPQGPGSRPVPRWSRPAAFRGRPGSALPATHRFLPDNVPSGDGLGSDRRGRVLLHVLQQLLDAPLLTFGSIFLA